MDHAYPLLVLRLHGIVIANDTGCEQVRLP